VASSLRLAEFYWSRLVRKRHHNVEPDDILSCWLMPTLGAERRIDPALSEDSSEEV